MGVERTEKLLRDWSHDQRPLSLRMVIARKFHLVFTGGNLQEVGDTGMFYYITSGFACMISPDEFKKREREETDAFERLIFSDPKFINVMQLIRSKDNEPVLIENLPKWIN